MKKLIPIIFLISHMLNAMQESPIENFTQPIISENKKLDSDSNVKVKDLMEMLGSMRAPANKDQEELLQNLHLMKETMQKRRDERLLAMLTLRK